MVRKFLRYSSNAVLLLVAVSIGCWSIFGGVALRPLWIAAGALLFQLSEYTFHRFLFHAPPSKWRWLLRLQHRLHYDHHVEPEHLDLLFLPLWFALPNLGLTGLAAWAALGDWRVAVQLLFGSVLALLHYEWVHYAAHVLYRPRTRFGRWMKKYHLWHHYKNEHFWFGVSNPVLDVVYRTYRTPGAVPRSTTTRKLHPDF